MLPSATGMLICPICTLWSSGFSYMAPIKISSRWGLHTRNLYFSYGIGIKHFEQGLSKRRGEKKRGFGWKCFATTFSERRINHVRTPWAPTSVLLSLKWHAERTKDMWSERWRRVKKSERAKSWVAHTRRDIGRMAVIDHLSFCAL